MLARDAMTLSPAVVTADTLIATVAQLMRDWDTGIVPIVDARDTMALIGVITDRDIVTRCVASRHGGGCEVGTHMTREHLITVYPETTLEACARRMEESQVRRLPVVDTSERVVGMVSLADVARKLGGSNPNRVASLVAEISQPVAVHS